MANHTGGVVGGVDAHADEHHAAVVDLQGRLLGATAFPTTGLTAGELGDLAAEHGLSLHQLRTEQATLEDVFMEQTDAHGEFRASQLEKAPG